MVPDKGLWIPDSQDRKDLYHLFAFDPGGTIGWAHLVISPEAFANRDAKVLRHLVHWDCGEFTGTEHEQIKAAVTKVRQRHIYKHRRMDVLGEDFELTQLIGGKNLLSPVRINAVLEWEFIRIGLTLIYQRRSMRTSVTKERLNAFGFTGKWTTTGKGKDAFAAMQHAVTWVRRVKRESTSRPWSMV